MLANSECQLWNAVNKMPRSRVFALLWRLRVKNEESGETNVEISIIPLSVFILFRESLSSFHLLCSDHTSISVAIHVHIA